MKLILNKNRGWRGLAEAQVLDDKNNTIHRMIFSFSQPVWNDMLKGVIVIPSEQHYNILYFDYESSRLPRPFQQRSVLIKNVIVPITGTKVIPKDNWQKEVHTDSDYGAINHFIKNRNNHTQSDWNCIGIRVIPTI